MQWLIVLIALAVAFTPALVAFKRIHDDRTKITVVNTVAVVWLVFCSMVYAPWVLALLSIIAWIWALVKSFR